MVKQKIKAQIQAMGWFLADSQGPCACSVFSPSKASFMSSESPKTSW